MQVILDSSFVRPGSAPIWGGKKGELGTGLIVPKSNRLTEIRLVINKRVLKTSFSGRNKSYHRSTRTEQTFLSLALCLHHPHRVALARRVQHEVCHFQAQLRGLGWLRETRKNVVCRRDASGSHVHQQVAHIFRTSCDSTG